MAGNPGHANLQVFIAYKSQRQQRAIVKERRGLLNNHGYLLLEQSRKSYTTSGFLRSRVLVFCTSNTQVNIDLGMPGNKIAFNWGFM